MTVRIRKWTDSKGRRKSAWVVDFVFTRPDGSRGRVDQRVAPLQSRAGAEAFEAELRQGLTGEAPPGLTLLAFQPRFMAYSRNNNKPSEVRSKEYLFSKCLLPFFGGMELSDITTEKVEDYKAKMADVYSPKSINNQLVALGRLLSLAVEYGHLTAVPKIRKLRVPQQPFDFLDATESKRLLGATSPQHWPMVALALKTGLRLGELLALQWRDIQPGRLIVSRAVWRGVEGTPKGGRTREVPLSPTATGALETAPRRGAYVFTDSVGQRLTQDGVDEVVPEACVAAGLRRATWHVLRHSFASQLAMKGVPLKAIQEFLGHADISTTMRYAHLSPAAKSTAVDLLE